MTDRMLQSVPRALVLALFAGHGTAGPGGRRLYNKGCRCHLCRLARAVYDRDRYAKARRWTTTSSPTAETKTSPDGPHASAAPRRA